MKRVSHYICRATLLLIVVLGSIGAPAIADDASERRVVFVSIQPQAFLLDEIAGDHVTIEVLLSPGQSPHTFEPSVRQMTRLADADMYFAMGVPFERHLRERYTGVLDDLRIVDCRWNIELLQIDGSHGHHDDHAAGDHHDDLVDPHVWLDPKNMKTMALTITDSLASIYPSLAGVFHGNLPRLQSRLDSLDQQVASILEPYRGRPMYVFHPAFGYLARAYGLRQTAIEDEGKEPSIRRLVELVNQISHESVAALCVQPEFSANEVETMAHELNTTVLRLDPLARDYIVNLKSIAASLADAYQRADSEDSSTGTPRDYR